MPKGMFVYDQLDILSFVQTTGSAVVEAFDASVDNLTTTGVSTETLDLEGKSYLGNSIYVVARADVNGVHIAGTGDPKIIATIASGAAAGSETTVHNVAYQVDAGEALEIPLPQSVGRFVKVSVKSSGGTGGSAAIVSGAVQVFIAKSGGLG